MKYRGMLFALALACAPAFAANTFESGGKTLRVNDAESELISALGEPARKVEIADRKGDKIGDYYYYTIDSKTIRFQIKNARIVEIFEMR
jgi:hypothetical protein